MSINRGSFLKQLGLGIASATLPKAVNSSPINEKFIDDDDTDYKFKIFVDRNMEGKSCEAWGDYDRAIELYKANVDAGFEGSFPYQRLDILYRKFGMKDNAKEVLNKAIELYKRLDRNSPTTNPSIISKLEYFENRLISLNKNQNRFLSYDKTGIKPVIIIRNIK